MNGDCSFIVWIAIIVIIVIFIMTNFSLITAYRNRNAKKNRPHWLQNINKSLKDPWHEEHEQMEALKKTMQEIKDAENKKNDTDSS